MITPARGIVSVCDVWVVYGDVCEVWEGYGECGGDVGRVIRDYQ